MDRQGPGASAHVTSSKNKVHSAGMALMNEKKKRENFHFIVPGKSPPTSAMANKFHNRWKLATAIDVAVSEVTKVTAHVACGT